MTQGFTSGVPNPLPASRGGTGDTGGRAGSGEINGFQMSNDAGDTAHDINIKIGYCKDNSNTYTIARDEITKQIDANWSAGDDAGGFPSGLTLSNSTWYHFFVIYDPATGNTDAGFDTSITASNLIADATAYTAYRRVGSVQTDGSANIIQFVQVGDEFMWMTSVVDVSGAACTTSETLYTLSVPPDVRVEVRYNFLISKSGNNPSAYVYSPDVNTQTPNTAVSAPLSSWRGVVATTTEGAGPFKTLTNTSKQIGAQSNLTSSVLSVCTLGWKDFRGQNNE